MALFRIWDGGTPPVVCIENRFKADFVNSEHDDSCGGYSVNNARRDFAIVKHFNLQNKREVSLAKAAGSVDGSLPADTSVATHYINANSLIKDVYFTNCTVGTGTVEVRVVANVGNDGTNPVETKDKLTDKAALASKIVPAYYGSVAVAKTAVIDLSKVGVTRIPVDMFSADEGMIIINNPAILTAACYSVILDVFDANVECRCECPVDVCPTEYAEEQECYINPV